MGNIRKTIDVLSGAMYQKGLKELTLGQLHNVISSAVIEHIADDWNNSVFAHNKLRRAYYFSAEFLVGRAVYNNLYCSDIYSEIKDILSDEDIDISCFEDIEDAALGNGGLGRLAACYLDSTAALSLPVDGYGIRYGYGLFKQSFENGFQKEDIDDWRRPGDPWSVRRDEDIQVVSFADGDVLAVPYDMPVIGYGSKHISTLRLWQAEPMKDFDFTLFNNQEYDDAVNSKNHAEDISRVLYPNDTTDAGKLLRLKQQYFFSSASLQDIIRYYKNAHGNDFRYFSKYVTIQLNDTHPVISIPELIRLMMREGCTFDCALSTATEVFNYTNHTIMQEALEKWSVDLIKAISPELEDIIRKISNVFLKELQAVGVNDGRLSELQILQGDTVHMAYLACRCSSHINGVAKLHTDILKDSVLKQWYALYPEKFVNVTNGITQRRWLGLCNPELSALITELLGTDEWLKDLSLLRQLEKYSYDHEILDRFMDIKANNKKRLCEYIAKNDKNGFDTKTIVDVQIKRLHEYKRQLLNILCILELYFEIKEGNLKNFVPTTFIFGAKAAPGYARAKAVIKLINEVAALIDNDSKVSKYIKVIFVSNYNVSYAEKIVAAADVSEQISTAGTEASGTGNMKLMLNGAVTLGTYDGANIEIVKEAGENNNYIFGARVEDLERVKGRYNPEEIYKKDKKIKRCLDALTDDTLDDGGTGAFKDLYDSLIKEDRYYLLLDFNDCLEAKLRVNQDYKDEYEFAKKCFMNMCSAGKFSSDRSVSEYAEKIWKIKPADL